MIDETELDGADEKTGFNPVAQSITLQPILPAEPILVCEPKFLSTLAKLEREIAHYKIVTPQDAQGAATILQRLTTAGTVLEAARTKVKAPFLAKCKEIDDAARAPSKRIEEAKTRVKGMQVAFAVEQARIAREAEDARRKELAQLEKLRQEEEAATAAKAREDLRLAEEAKAKASASAIDVDFGEDAPAAAPAAEGLDVDFGDDDDTPAEIPKTEIEQKIEQLKYAPAAAASKPTGVRFITTLVIDKTDVSRLPDCFVIKTPNEKALRATFCQGYKDGDPVPEVPGVTFRVVRDVKATGRDQF